MKYELYETCKENGNRITKVENSTRLKDKTRTLACIINIDEGKKWQKFHGFGAALTEASGYVLEKSGKLDEVLEKYYKDNKYLFARTHLNSSDFSLGNFYNVDENGNHDFTRQDKYILPLLKEAEKLTNGKLKLVVSPWSPPPFMKTNGEMNNGGKLKKECYSSWAEEFVAYFKHLKEKGIKVWAATCQNETEATQVWDSCLYTAKEEGEFANFYLGPTLEKNGFKDVKILVWDHNRDGLYRRLTGSLEVGAKYIDGAAFHWYSGDQYENVRKVRDEFPSLELVFTEGSVEGGARDGAWYTGERYAHNVLNDIANGATAWIDWNIALDLEGGPNHVGNFCDATTLIDLDKNEVKYQSSYYYIGQFSRFIEPESTVLTTTINSWMTPATPDGRIGNYMEAVSLLSPSGDIILVVLNRSEADMDFVLNISNEDKKAEGYFPPEVKEKIFTCPPRAIQTYIFHK